MSINVLLLWLLGHPLPWHLGWLRNWSSKFLLVHLTQKWQTSICSTITNTAQWFRQLFLFPASKHFWNLLNFFSLITADTCQRLPTDKFVAGQGKTALWFLLAICPRSSAGSGSFWELPSCVFTELTYILRGFQWYIRVPLHLGASKNLEYLSLGCAFRLQKSLKYQWAKQHQFEHKQGSCG